MPLVGPHLYLQNYLGACVASECYRVPCLKRDCTPMKGTPPRCQYRFRTLSSPRLRTKLLVNLQHNFPRTECRNKQFVLAHWTRSVSRDGLILSLRGINLLLLLPVECGRPLGKMIGRATLMTIRRFRGPERACAPRKFRKRSLDIRMRRPITDKER